MAPVRAGKVGVPPYGLVLSSAAANGALLESGDIGTTGASYGPAQAVARSPSTGKKVSDAERPTEDPGSAKNAFIPSLTGFHFLAGSNPLCMSPMLPDLS